MEIRVGDWVRFEQCGAVVLGIVQYIEQSKQSYPYKAEAITDRGRIEISKILECRSFRYPLENK